MRGRPERLGNRDQAGTEQALADQAPVIQYRELPAGAGSGQREALMRRLEQLPPGHPSSVCNGEPRGATVRSDKDWLSGRGRLPDEGGRPAHPDIAQPPDGLATSFRGKIEHFNSLWKSHLERWPERSDRTPGADKVRADDPPGSWRGDGDRYLSPEQNAEVDWMIELLHRPEKAITELLTKIEQDNPFGGHLVGLDHRLKGERRLKEKIVDALEGEVATSVADAAGEIDDAVRYTFSFGTQEYTDGHGYVQHQLEAAGCQRTYNNDHWIDDPQYKGINSRWNTPDGDRFELQFHTPESFYAKEHLTHRSYDRLRLPQTSRPEQRDLKAYQAEVSSAVPQPARVIEMTDIRNEAV